MVAENGLDTFYGAGNDALTNMFEVAFTGTHANSNINDNFIYRVTNFSLPEKTANTYDKWYQGHKYATPSGLDGDPKTCNFTFRLKNDFTFYEGIRAWIDTVKTTPDLASDWRCTVDISPIDQEGDAVGKGWTFDKWFPTSISGITFDQQSGEPISVQVTGAFFTCTESV